MTILTETPKIWAGRGSFAFSSKNIGFFVTWLRGLAYTWTCSEQLSLTLLWIEQELPKIICFLNHPLHLKCTLGFNSNRQFLGIDKFLTICWKLNLLVERFSTLNEFLRNVLGSRLWFVCEQWGQTCSTSTRTQVGCGRLNRMSLSYSIQKWKQVLKSWQLLQNQKSTPTCVCSPPTSRVLIFWPTLLHCLFMENMVVLYSEDLDMQPAWEYIFQIK